MNSEIITGTERRTGTSRRRGSRRRRSPFIFLLIPAVLVLFGAGIFVFTNGPAFPFHNRYRLAERTALTMNDCAPPSFLPGFAEDLAVVRLSSDDDQVMEAGSAIAVAEGEADAVYAKNAFQKMNPASTTKVMTCLVALDRINLQETWTAGPEIYVSDKAASLAGFHEGDSVSALDVLYGLMLPSGADAANMIALHLAGGEEQFVALMNEKAAELGCTGTHFTNTHGLTDDLHYSTAYDLYLILRAAMKNPVFREIAGSVEHTADYTDAAGAPVQKKWKNTNFYMSGKAVPPEGYTVTAGKTGTTLAAGNCLVLAGTDAAGTECYSVVLKAAKRDLLYTDMNLVLEKLAGRQ